MAVAVVMGPWALEGAATTLAVPAPPVDEFVPQAGDVALVAVWRPAGVLVIAPAGWTQDHTVENVPHPERTELMGDVTVWHRLLAGTEVWPVVMTLSRSALAEALLRIERPPLPMLTDQGAPLMALAWTSEAAGASEIGGREDVGEQADEPIRKGEGQ